MRSYFGEPNPIKFDEDYHQLKQNIKDLNKHEFLLKKSSTMGSSNFTIEEPNIQSHADNNSREEEFQSTMKNQQIQNEEEKLNIDINIKIEDKYQSQKQGESTIINYDKQNEIDKAICELKKKVTLEKDYAKINISKVESTPRETFQEPLYYSSLLLPISIFSHVLINWYLQK